MTIRDRVRVALVALVLVAAWAGRARGQGNGVEYDEEGECPVPKVYLPPEEARRNPTVAAEAPSRVAVSAATAPCEGCKALESLVDVLVERLRSRGPADTGEGAPARVLRFPPAAEAEAQYRELEERRGHEPPRVARALVSLLQRAERSDDPVGYLLARRDPGGGGGDDAGGSWPVVDPSLSAARQLASSVFFTLAVACATMVIVRSCGPPFAERVNWCAAVTQLVVVIAVVFVAAAFAAEFQSQRQLEEYACEYRMESKKAWCTDPNTWYATVHNLYRGRAAVQAECEREYAEALGHCSSNNHLSIAWRVLFSALPVVGRQVGEALAGFSSHLNWFQSVWWTATLPFVTVAACLAACAVAYLACARRTAPAPLHHLPPRAAPLVADGEQPRLIRDHEH